MWLSECYKRELPDWDTEKNQLSDGGYPCQYQRDDSNLADIEAAARQDLLVKKWFASAVEKASVGMAVNEYGQRLVAIDTALTKWKCPNDEDCNDTGGEISGCYNLDGFIAEQYHVNTFNAEAALKKFKICGRGKSSGAGRSIWKKSFDLVIKRQFYWKDRSAVPGKIWGNGTGYHQTVKSGNYNNQRFLVPSEQVAEVQAAFPGKTVTGTIGDAETGVFSKPLTKQGSKAVPEVGPGTGNQYKD